MARAGNALAASVVERWSTLLQILKEACVSDSDARSDGVAVQRFARQSAHLSARLLAALECQDLRPSRVEPAALLSSLAGLLQGTLDRRIHVTVDVAPDCAPCLADATRLEAALIELAINARDAMPDGGSLGFRADGGTSAGIPVRLVVEDNGCGMSPDVRECAMEPFFTTREGDSRAGLGLSVVRGFAHQSGGFFDLQSVAGQGTIATLSLPRGLPSESPESGLTDAT